MGGRYDQSLRFRSTGRFSELFSCDCWSKRKLPGHVNPTASSAITGVHGIPKFILASLNLAVSTVPSLFDLWTSEWGLTPRVRIIGTSKDKPVISIIFWQWYLLTAPLSLLWAFWWPPKACELKNFLMQKLHENTLGIAVLDSDSVSDLLPRLKLSHSPWLSSLPSPLLLLSSPSMIILERVSKGAEEMLTEALWNKTKRGFRSK